MQTAVDRSALRAPHAVVPPLESDDVGEAVDASSLLEPLERVLASLRRMGSCYAQLAVMDARRAAIQLAWLVGAGIVTSVLVVTAWLALVVAIGVVLLGKGLSWPAVLGIGALLNVVAAGLVVWRVKGVFEHAPFAAMLKQLKSEPAAGEQEP